MWIVNALVAISFLLLSEIRAGFYASPFIYFAGLDAVSAFRILLINQQPRVHPAPATIKTTNTTSKDIGSKVQGMRVVTSFP